MALTEFLMEPFGDSPNVAVGVRSRAMPSSSLNAPEQRQPRFAPKGPIQSMLVRIPEVATVLALVLALLAAKHVPQLGFLPLSQMTGIVCFAFAIFLALRIYREELEKLRARE